MIGRAWIKHLTGGHAEERQGLPAKRGKACLCNNFGGATAPFWYGNLQANYSVGDKTKVSFTKI